MFPFHSTQDLCNIVQPIQPNRFNYSFYYTKQIYFTIAIKREAASSATTLHLPPGLLDLPHLMLEKVQDILQVLPPKDFTEFLKVKINNKKKNFIDAPISPVSLYSPKLLRLSINSNTT